MSRIRAVAVFLFVSVLAALPAAWNLMLNDKLVLHAMVNNHHTVWGDVVFPYLTNVADGWMVVVVALVMLAVHSWRAFLMVGLSSGLSALVTQTLKRLVFSTSDRPSMFRDSLGEMTWVEGVDLHAHFSFPSGHATAAFSMCMAVTVILGKQGWAALLAALAVLLGFSRVYLSQHFTQDVFAGAAVGIMVSLVVGSVLYRGHFATRTWLDATPFRRQNQ
ncbi:MAG: phosphatase PAP2 family protein [Flavobacteriales bacterium]|nr:phosphatase PAP2 family protein [Flavobacteriales bacterium]